MKIKTDCHGEVEVIDAVWYNILNYGMVYGNFPMGYCIGIVKMKNQQGEEKMYIGLGKGENLTQDIKLVLDCGVPFYGEIK